MTASLLPRPGLFAGPALGPFPRRALPAPGGLPFVPGPGIAGQANGAQAALQGSLRPSRGHQGALPVAGLPAIPLAVSVLLLLLACLIAPEQPWDQEAICHRQAGVEACRVW